MYYLCTHSNNTNKKNKHDKMKNLTIEDLKARKSYIIAKVTKVAGAENVSTYMKVMLFQVEMKFEGSVYDCFMEVHNNLRSRSRKATKAADARGYGEKLSYSDEKFGQQHFVKF